MDIGMLHAPVYSGITTALLMILQIVLMFKVIGQRGKSEIGIGSGGNDEMEQAIRVHGNLTENAPIFLIGLALIELLSGSTIWVAILGGIFVVARVLHAIGLGMSSGVTPGRLIGTLGTMLSIVVAAVYLGYLAVTAL